MGQTGEKWRRILGAALAFSLISGCGAAASGVEDWNPAFQNALGLTREQRLEDFDYLVSTLKDSYLCLGIHDRENPDYPAEDIFRDYREMIEETDSDEAFYSAVYSTLYLLGTYGHLWLIEPEAYQDYLSAYCDSQTDGQADTQAEERTHWKEVLESPGTKEGYEKLKKMLEAQEDEDESENADTETAEKKAANICILQLPASGIAYVKIDSFPAEYEEDQKQLFSLFDSLEGYTDLIIDVTENSGGSELYWQNLLVSPFIEESISCTNYALLADSENNRPYIENVFSEEELHPIGELPALPKLNREGLEAADYYVESVLHVSPGNYRAPFEGRIWLLVGPQVYSASESFAVFCKETGFAKLVGEQTGGDGIGSLDPVFLQLPNSGILVQYTMMYGLNPDGSSSEEAGTTPDILSDGSEDPLVTALREIEKASH